MVKTPQKRHDIECEAALIIGLASHEIQYLTLVSENLPHLHERLDLNLLILCEVLIVGAETSRQNVCPLHWHGEQDGSAAYLLYAQLSQNALQISSHYHERLRKYLSIAFNNQKQVTIWYEIGERIYRLSSLDSQTSAQIAKEVQSQESGLVYLKQAAVKFTEHAQLKSHLDLIIREVERNLEADPEGWQITNTIERFKRSHGAFNAVESAIIKTLAKLEYKHPDNRFTADQIILAMREIPDLKVPKTWLDADKSNPRLRDALSRLRKIGVLQPSMSQEQGYRLSTEKCEP